MQGSRRAVARREALELVYFSFHACAHCCKAYSYTHCCCMWSDRWRLGTLHGEWRLGTLGMETGDTTWGVETGDTGEWRLGTGDCMGTLHGDTAWGHCMHGDTAWRHYMGTLHGDTSTRPHAITIYMLTVARHTHCIPYAHYYKALISAQCLPVTRLTGTGHHQRPSYMPPCYNAHCYKASSVPYTSLLQDSLLQAPLPAYLASVLCVQRCVDLRFIPVMVWSGLCFIPRRSGLVWSGLVWSGLVCVLYPTACMWVNYFDHVVFLSDTSAGQGRPSTFRDQQYNLCTGKTDLSC